jgi:hypothetical protein
LQIKDKLKQKINKVNLMGQIYVTCFFSGFDHSIIMRKLRICVVLLGISAFSCSESIEQIPNNTTVDLSGEEKVPTETEPLIELLPEIVIDRDSIETRLAHKVKNGQPLVVHALVPLCDNENQGIVPVAEHLGKGRDLKGNLYWACGHGMKAYFKNRHGWKHVRTDSIDSPIILERSVFVKTFPNRAKVYLISDAYAGDQMEACLQNYFAYLSGKFYSEMPLENDTIPFRGGADLIVFNGHNGLMDMRLDVDQVKKASFKEGMSISCSSNYFFQDYYKKTGSYPLVHTTGLLYPGAFIVNDVLGQWAQLKSPEKCRVAAGEAYNREMKCGRQGGINLFKGGW